MSFFKMNDAFYFTERTPTDRSVCLHALIKPTVCGGQMDTHFWQSPSVGHMVAHKTRD